MTKEGILTEKDVIRSMLVETQNNLLKMEITDRLFNRAKIRGEMNEDMMRRMGANQLGVRQAKQMVKDLVDFLKDAKEENPLADLFPQE